MTERYQTHSPDSTRASLLDRVRLQEAGAWHCFIELYGPLVYHWCHRLDLRPDDTDDVFQEVFRAVATHITSFRKDRPGDSFRGWLLTITRNKIRDCVRRQRQHVQAVGGSDALRLLDQVPDPFDDQQEESADSDETQGLVRRALRLLQHEFENTTWIAFWRVTVEGQAPADVAAALGISLNAVYKAKSRVLSRLRQELGEVFE